MEAVNYPVTKHHRAIFLSDIHLGIRASQADVLLHFIRYNTADRIYLVGDIVDLWKVRRGSIYWPQSHNDVLQKLMRQARKGTEIVYIPGNHDEAIRQFTELVFGSIEIQRDAVHETATGKRYAVMHGDEFDVIVRYAKWLAFLGDRSYEFALWSNGPLNFIRKRFGLGYWSLSAYLKGRVKGVVSFIGEYEQNLAEVARRKGLDGAICGHIHQAADRMIDDVHYMNCGDWVESCTAITESQSGEMQVVNWRPFMEAERNGQAELSILEAAE